MKQEIDNFSIYLNVWDYTLLFFINLFVTDKYGFCKPVSERPDNVKNGIRLTNGSGFEIDIQVLRKFKYLESYKWYASFLLLYICLHYRYENLGHKEVHWSVSNATSRSISRGPFRGQ